MDFRVFKKDRKPGADGLFGWESEGLKARLAEARKAPTPTKGVGVNLPHSGNTGMILRDAGITSTVKVAERSSNDLPPLPDRLEGYGHWVCWEPTKDSVCPVGAVKGALQLRNGFVLEWLTGTLSCYRWCSAEGYAGYSKDADIVAYCLKDPQ